MNILESIDYDDKRKWNYLVSALSKKEHVFEVDCLPDGTECYFPRTHNGLFYKSEG